jgi:hypothetical protein
LKEKGGGLQAEEHHPNREARRWQHHVVGMDICRYIEATSQDISLNIKLKLGRKWVLQMKKDPKHTSKVVAK